MNLKELVAALIRVFEGCRLVAYQDSGGVWTIGFGHTKDVKAGDTCTFEQAQDWLLADAEPLFNVVTDIPNLKTPAYAAYISFGYNCGLGALRLVLAQKATLSHFVHDKHGNELPGLVSRRALEQELINA